MMRTARRAAAVIVTAALVLTGTTTAGADDIDDRRAAAEAQQRAMQDEREQLESELEHTDAELAQAVLDLNTVEARLPVAEAELAAAEAELERAEREAAILAQRLSDAQLEEAQVAQQIQEGAGKVEEARADIAQMAREEFRGTDDTSALGLVTGAQSTEEFIDGYAASSSAARSQSRTLAELQAQEAIARNLQARLGAIRETITELKRLADENVVAKEAAREAAEARKAEIEALIEQQRQLNATIEARKQAAVEELDANVAEGAAIEEDLKKIIAEQTERDRRLEKERRKAAEAGAGAPAAGAFLGWPTADPVITSTYGMRVHPVLGYRRLHAGTDFRAYCGTPILAAQSGTVLYARTLPGLGNQVLVNHGYANGSSVMSSYNHLSAFAVSSGQQVSRGQVVGYSGTSGTSTACHLHFEVYVDGGTVDPMGWLP
jgi:murein DD-endopeptidase MepM/ murein hydrolase activator NlpD